MSNQNKYVLITGGSSGIGYELSKLFARDGYNLIIVARDEVELDTTRRELQETYLTNVITISKDLFNRESSYEIYNEVKSRGITVDILVNNAGQGQYGEFIHNDIDRELDIIELNVVSLVILTKLFVREMVERGEGKVLFTASIASKLPGPLNAVYHATKAFVHSFAEALRSEINDRGITVTSLLPGATDTDFFRKAEMEDAKIVQESSLSDPADVAKDGYEALMSGDDMVVSGFKNKMQVGMSNIIPDETVANMMKKQQEPVEEK